MSFFERILRTNAPAATLLVRLIVGPVFLSEGIQKFLFPAEVGAGRLTKIGIPSPESAAVVVASFEILCGALITIGLLTRLAVIPTITIMLVAISSTKIPILFEKGFWSMAHDSRTDWSMLLGSIFLLLVGAGKWSIDHKLSRDRSS